MEARYWLDMGSEMTLYRKPADEDGMDVEVWAGKMEDAGTYEGDPDWQEKLDSFFEKELEIKADEWEVG